MHHVSSISMALRGAAAVGVGLTICVFLVGCSENQSDSDVSTVATQAREREYVGDEACASCHTDVHGQYHQTGMGRSLSQFDSTTAPERFTDDTVVYDEANELYYEAFLQDGNLYQREFRLDEEGNQIHELTYKADHVIGSGKATRSYLMENNGYVTEMPLTWYADRENWDMSPGYRQSNPRFSRPINLECMTCHSSRPERTPFTQNHYERVPEAISCERCHGPGSAHVSRWQQANSSAKKPSETTIVNPADLSRDARMDVCLQCHLPGVAVFKPGEDPTTFQPSEPLAAHRTVFYPKEQISQPRTFGIDSHPIRLANSACFERSNMTCITCHNTHESPGEQTRAEYNAVCQSCHGGEADPADRVAEVEAAGGTCSRSEVHGPSEETMTGDCVSCHMQQGGTSDIPHIVFTDHWIRRDPPAALQPEDIQRMESRDTPFTLVRIRDNLTSSQKPSRDRTPVDDGTAELEAAVAYFKLYETQHMLADYLPMVVDRARRGFRKGAEMVEARIALGRALAGMDSLQAAEQALATAAEHYPNHAWVHLWLGDVRLKRGRLQGALRALQQARQLQPALIETHVKYASALQRNGQNARAVKILEQVTRRDSIHHPQAWNNLGLLYLQNQNVRKAKPALKRAVRLDPNSVQARVNLGSAYILERSIEEAVLEFERAVAVDSTFAPAYGNLGLIYMQQGHREKAREMFQRVLRLKPGDQRAQAMIQRLNQLE